MKHLKLYPSKRASSFCKLGQKVLKIIETATKTVR